MEEYKVLVQFSDSRASYAIRSLDLSAAESGVQSCAHGAGAAGPNNPNARGTVRPTTANPAPSGSGCAC